MSTIDTHTHSYPSTHSSVGNDSNDLVKQDNNSHLKQCIETVQNLRHEQFRALRSLKTKSIKRESLRKLEDELSDCYYSMAKYISHLIEKCHYSQQNETIRKEARDSARHVCSVMTNLQNRNFIESSSQSQCDVHFLLFIQSWIRHPIFNDEIDRLNGFPLLLKVVEGMLCFSLPSSTELIAQCSFVIVRETFDIQTSRIGLMDGSLWIESRGLMHLLFRTFVLSLGNLTNAYIYQFDDIFRCCEYLRKRLRKSKPIGKLVEKLLLENNSSLKEDPKLQRIQDLLVMSTLASEHCESGTKIYCRLCDSPMRIKKHIGSKACASSGYCCEKCTTLYSTSRRALLLGYGGTSNPEEVNRRICSNVVRRNYSKIQQSLKMFKRNSMIVLVDLFHVNGHCPALSRKFELKPIWHFDASKVDPISASCTFFDLLDNDYIGHICEVICYQSKLKGNNQILVLCRNANECLSVHRICCESIK